MQGKGHGAGWRRWLLGFFAMLISAMPLAAASAAEMPDSLADDSTADSGDNQKSSSTFMILGLSWQPGFCEGKANLPECRNQSADDPAARQFSLTGLWRLRQTYCGVADALKDQDKKHKWLDMPELALGESLKVELARAMPGMASGLERHEWVKHGTCSGLSQQRYFSLLRAAFSRIKLPPVIFNGSINRNLKTGDIEDLMTSFNPGMTQDGISVICEKGKLSEIRICMTKSLDYRACGEVDRQSCNKSVVTLPGILKEKIE